MNTTLVIAQSTGTPVEFTPAEGYTYTGVASSTLVWPEGKLQYFTLNLTLGEAPTNTSRIEIPLIAINFIGEINNIEAIVGTESLTPDIKLSNSNRSVLINQSLLPPEIVDFFYFNITLLSRTAGGNLTQPQPLPYNMRFPDSGTILVDRDKLVPLINLYGFPPRSFFAKWLPIYGGLLFLLLTPSIFVGISKLVEYRISYNSKEETEEEVETNE
ncbi:MAG: hypothetical protein ACXAD7_04095 [Candidatus Kariarchaeaceae archaeon]|jgi:hypothetical protein